MAVALPRGVKLGIGTVALSIVRPCEAAARLCFVKSGIGKAVYRIGKVEYRIGLVWCCDVMRGRG